MTHEELLCKVRVEIGKEVEKRQEDEHAAFDGVSWQSRLAELLTTYERLLKVSGGGKSWEPKPDVEEGETCATCGYLEDNLSLGVSKCTCCLPCDFYDQWKKR